MRIGLPHRPRSTKGVLLTLFTIVLFTLMLGELITYIVLNINYDNLSVQVGGAYNTGASVQSINYSISSFLHSSLTNALEALTYYESTPSVRKDSFVNGTGTALASIMSTGSYDGYSLSSYEPTTVGQYANAITSQSVLQNLPVSITNASLTIFQSGPFSIEASYSALLTVNTSGSVSNYPIDAVTNVTTGFKQYLLAAEQGSGSAIVPGTASPNATLVGNMYAQSGSVSPYMFAYGTVVYYGGQPNCGNIASQYKNSNYILATPDATDINDAVCGMAGLVTNRTNASTPQVPYLLYNNDSIMAYLQGAPSMLLAGQRLALLNVSPLQQAVESGYAYGSPYTATYLQRSENDVFGTSPNGFYTFSPLATKVGKFNGATSSIEAPGSILSGSPFTISAWVLLNQNSGTFPMIIDNKEGNAMFFGVNIGIGHVGLNLYMGSVLQTLNDYLFPKGVWQYVTATYNGSMAKVYEDGVFVSNSAPGTYTGFNGIYIGNGTVAGNSFWNGSIANVQLYNTSLPAAQVSQLYHEGISGTPISNAGLVGWWPLNGNATDLSGLGNNGTTTNVIYAAPPAYTYSPLSSQVPGAPTGMVGKFTPNQNISIQTSSPLLEGSNVTMAVWINWNGGNPGGRQEILGADSAAGSELNPIIAVNDSGTQEAETWVCVSTCYPEAKSGPHTIIPHMWYFLVSRYNGSTGEALSLWINGQQAASTAATGNLVPQGSGLYAYIGSRSNTGDYFNGQIADAQMYGSALTKSEIEQLYSEGINGGPIAEANVVGWWPLSGNANDYSGNDHNGVPHGATYTPLENDPTADVVEGVLNCGNLNQCSNTTLQHLYLNPLPLEHAGMGFMNETTSFNMMDAALPGAMSFDGVSGYVAAQVGAWLGTNHNLTIAAWYYSSKGGGSIVNVCTSQTCGGWSTPFLGYDTNGSTYAWINGPAVLWTSTPFGKWYFAEITYSASGNLETLYIDGKEVTSASGTYSPSGTTDYATIGADPTGQHYGNVYFNGSITDVQVYDVALTPAQAMQLYLNNSAIGVAPINYWPLGAGIGSLLNQTADISGSNTGYLYGSNTPCTNSQVVNGVCGPTYAPA